MGSRQISTVALAVLFIAGCAPAEPPPAKPSTFADPLLQQKDKAREVQNVVDENAARTRASVDSQERGDPAP